MLLTLVMMTIVMLIVDSIAYVVIKEALEADISFLSLVSYRIIINFSAFLFASFVKTPMKLYQVAVVLTILALALQLVMPVMVSLTGLTIISSLHPVLMFVESELNIPWLIIIIILILVWIWRDKNAGS